jgi:hypothetical protein
MTPAGNPRTYLSRRVIVKKKSLKSYSTLLLLVLLLFAAGNTSAATTEIISVSNEGVPGSTNDMRQWTNAEISHDGRYVVFRSVAKLTAGDSDPYADIYLRDRLAGTTTLLTPTNFNGLVTLVGSPMISGDGNYIAIRTGSSSGVAWRGMSDLLLINRASGTIEPILRGMSVGQYTIDYDGDFYFVSDLSTTYSPYHHNIHKYDRRTKQITPIYTTSTEIWAAWHISVDDSGSLLSFSEKTSNQDSRPATYLLNLTTNNKTLLSRTRYGTSPNGSIFGLKVSNNGKFVIFVSAATNLEPAPYPTGSHNMFLYDVDKDTVERVAFDDPQYGELYPTARGYSRPVNADISDDGRFIVAALAYPEAASHMYGAVLDRQTGKIEFLPDGILTNNMLYPVITPDGRYIVSTGITPLANGVFTLLYDRYGSDQTFSVDAGADQLIEQETANGAYATLAGLLTGDSCSEDQTYRWSWADGETIGTNPTIALPPGTTTVTLDWSGCGGTASDTVDVTVEDTTPPSSSLTGINGTAGNAGWYRGNVSLQLAAADNGSGVAAIYYNLDGVETVAAGASASVSVNGDGAHTISYWAVDNVENSETPVVTTIQIDSIAPSLTGAPLTQPNANGWYNSDVTVHFSATDSMSGIDSITPDTTVSTEGAGQSVTGTAFDLAGNSTDYSVTGINLDRTAPLIKITGVTDGAAYNLGLVPQAAFTASDLLSGITDKSAATTGTPDAFGCGTFTYRVSATDQAGNATSSFVTYEIKATPEGTSNLIDELVNLGTLPSQTAETIQASLAKALSGYSSNSNLGDNMMNTFQNQINAALNSGKISSATAALLNNAANYIMLNN